MTVDGEEKYKDKKYSLGLTPNAVLRRKAAGLVEDAERRCQRERQPVRLFGKFSYKAGS